MHAGSPSRGEHLEPLITTSCAVMPATRPALWANALGRLVGAVVWLAERLGETERACEERLELLASVDRRARTAVQVVALGNAAWRAAAVGWVLSPFRRFGPGTL